MAKFGVSVATTEEGTAQRPQYENLPNGNYLLHMEAGEIVEKNVGAQDHSIMLKSTFEVLEPEEFKGRKLFGNYNLKNKSEIAQKIGNEQFQCLLRAVGIEEVTEDSDTDDLLFISFVATVGLGKDSKEKNADGTPQYPGRPEIKRYWYPDMNDAPALGVAGPATPANDNKPAAARPAASTPATKKPGETPWQAAARKRAEEAAAKAA
jgi:hypothetical protein